MPNAPTRRLLRSMTARRVERDRRTIATGPPLDRYYAEVTEKLLGATAAGNIGRIAGILASVIPDTLEIMAEELTAMVRWSIDSAQQAFLTAYTPIQWVAILRQRAGLPLTVRVTEQVNPIEIENELRPILSGAVQGQAARDLLQQVMFDPKSPSTIQRLLMKSNAPDGIPWNRRFSTVAFQDLRELRTRLVSGVSQGQSIAQLRPSIDELVGGVRFQAQRIVRTESLRIAEEGQREEWDELGFELHMGPDRENPVLPLDTPAFAPILAAWQREPIETEPQMDAVFSCAHETRQN